MYQTKKYLQILELDVKMDTLQIFILSVNYIPLELFAKALVDSETVDVFKYGLKDLNSPLY